MESQARPARFLLAFVLVLAPLGGIASRPVSAGTVVDPDADLVPDPFADCTVGAPSCTP